MPDESGELQDTVSENPVADLAETNADSAGSEPGENLAAEDDLDDLSDLEFLLEDIENRIAPLA